MKATPQFQFCQFRKPGMQGQSMSHPTDNSCDQARSELVVLYLVMDIVQVREKL